jgi:CheY-like chemotaxis protein
MRRRRRSLARALQSNAMTQTLSDEPLAARRILVVEDEFLVARYLARGLAEGGAEVLGPVARTDQALDRIQAEYDAGRRIDGAILDVTLNDVSALPVADRLVEHGVPFVFATGYDRAALPPRFSEVALCIKPVQVRDLIRTLARAIEQP